MLLADFSKQFESNKNTRAREKMGYLACEQSLVCDIYMKFHIYDLYMKFHINVTSFHCTGRYELNKLTSLPTYGFMGQLVQHRSGIAEVTGSNPVKP